MKRAAYLVVGLLLLSLVLPAGLRAEEGQEIKVVIEQEEAATPSEDQPAPPPAEPEVGIYDVRVAFTSATGDLERAVGALSPETNPIFIWFRFQGVSPGTDIRSVWYYKEFDPPQEIGEAGTQTVAETDYAQVSLSRSEGKKWPQGKYEVGLFVGSERLASAEFTVGAEAGPGPAPAPPPEAGPLSREQLIAGLLASAEEDLAARRLTTPASQNAYDKYMRVLSLDLNNQRAHEGLSRIVGLYVAMAESRIARGDWTQAERFLTKADSVIPNDPRTRRMWENLALAMQPPPPPPPPAPMTVRGPQGDYSLVAPVGWRVASDPAYDLFLRLDQPMASFGVEVIHNQQGEESAQFFTRNSQGLMRNSDYDILETRMISWRGREANRVLYQIRSLNQTVLEFIITDRPGYKPSRFYLLRAECPSYNYSELAGVLQSLVDSFQIY